MTDEGIHITAMQWKVVNYLRANGPKTGREIDVALGGDGFHKRCSELEGIGVLRRVAPRLCTVTKRTTQCWRVGGVQPGDA